MISLFSKIRSKRIVLLFLSFVMLASIGLPAARVLAVPDVIYYSGNSIFNYDPDKCGTGTDGGTSPTKTGGLVGNDNYEKALRYYVGKKLTLAQAAGIVGNFMQESRMNPAVIEGGKIVDASYKLEVEVGFGIAQWTSKASEKDDAKSRQNKLTAYSSSSKRSIIDLGMQLDFTWVELNDAYASTLKALKKETDPEKAAVTFHNGYEGSGDDAEGLAVRSKNAEDIYTSYKAKIPDSTSAKSDTASCTGSGEASAYVDGFAIYDQNDPQWADIWYGGPSDPKSDLHGNVASAGCGPSSMAMVITALTKQKVTPKDTAVYGREHGTVANNSNGSAGGSLHNLEIIGKNWNLDGKSVEKSVAAINEGLRAGGLVVASGIGTAPWTDKGHFITIRAVNSNGKWLLGDSNGKIGLANSKKEWDPADLVNRMGDYHFLFSYKGKKL